MMLLRAKKSILNYMADTTISGAQERELYACELVRSTLRTFNQYGYWQNILTPDPHRGNQNDEIQIWKPGHVYDAKHDMPFLRPLGGRTVQSPGVYIDYPIACVDFAAQYPNIMRTHNIGLSSLLRDTEILSLKKDIDYTTIFVRNVRPSLTHACSKKRKCNAGVNGQDDPLKCKYTITYERTGTDVHFATSSLLNAIVSQSSTDLAEQRKKYKELRDTLGITSDEKDLFDILQNAVKLRMNGAYGVLMRCSSLVGGAVMQMGRLQNENVSTKGLQENFLVVNGDTDSVKHRQNRQTGTT